MRAWGCDGITPRLRITALCTFVIPTLYFALAAAARRTQPTPVRAIAVWRIVVDPRTMGHSESHDKVQLPDGILSSGDHQVTWRSTSI
jgi:hypothetical protein